MKKTIFIAIAVSVMVLTGCTNNKKAPVSADSMTKDSLESVIAQKDSDLNDVMGLINEVQEGFREINEAQNRVNIVKDGEGANKAQQIRENIKFISATMKHNHELIEKLQKQLSQSTLHGNQMKAAIDNLVQQLDDKDQQLQQMRAQLDAKDIHITELDETINNLNTNVSNLNKESSSKSETINTQDKQLNTAWYVFGTKDELKEQHILIGKKLMQANFNNSYFTKIDIRNLSELKLYSKYAKIMTVHPSSSYTLTRDANKQYILNITNPNIFWSTSKYLVIVVK